MQLNHCCTLSLYMNIYKLSFVYFNFLLYSFLNPHEPTRVYMNKYIYIHVVCILGYVIFLFVYEVILPILFCFHVCLNVRTFTVERKKEKSIRKMSIVTQLIFEAFTHISTFIFNVLILYVFYCCTLHPLRKCCTCS